MNDPVSFWVPVQAAPKGSGRAVAAGVYLPGSSKVGQKRIAAFTLAVKWCAVAAMRGRAKFSPLTPIAVELTFYLAKPKSNRDREPIRPPDLDKCVRACLDGLGAVIDDDARVVEIVARKHWADDRGPGVTVVVAAAGAP